MININKKYTTRDGREVRIYATDGVGLYPIHGAFLNFNGSTDDKSWSFGTWTNNGLYDIAVPYPDSLDLVEVWPSKDKEPTWCWDREEVERNPRFWDIENNCIIIIER